MSAETPETLLRSALEKIVYFEARSTQLSHDLERAHGELDKVKGELAHASQREIELRRVVAELEVRVTRAHAEREEAAQLNDALRRERSELIASMLDASRINGTEGIDGFDLAQFIAQLRSEVLVTRDGHPVVAAPLPSAPPPPAASAPDTSTTRFAHELKSQGRLTVSAAELNVLSGGRSLAGVGEESLLGFSLRELQAPDVAGRVRAAERLRALANAAAAPALASALHAETEPVAQVAMLAALATLAQAEAGPVVVPLLSSPDAEVRVAALKALLEVDARRAGPHLAAAMRDPDKAVRRRASLLALGLPRADALELGTVAIADADADVRALAALVLGASQADAARPLLLEAMKDGDVRVRRAASQALSTVLGRDVTNLVDLDEAHRRREVRRLATAAPVSAAQRTAHRVQAAAGRARDQAVRDGAAPHQGGASGQAAPSGDDLQARRLQSRVSAAAQDGATQQPVMRRAHGEVTAPNALSASTPHRPAPGTPRAAVAGLVAAGAQLPAPSRIAVLEDTVPANAVLADLRTSLRGKTLPDLAASLQAPVDAVTRTCGALLTSGAVVRRGHKYFAA